MKWAKSTCTRVLTQSLCLVIKNDSCALFCQARWRRRALWRNPLRPGGKYGSCQRRSSLPRYCPPSPLRSSPRSAHPTPARHLSQRLDNAVTVYYRLSRAIIFNRWCHSHIKISADKKRSPPPKVVLSRTQCGEKVSAVLQRFPQLFSLLTSRNRLGHQKGRECNTSDLFPVLDTAMCTLAATWRHSG